MVRQFFIAGGQYLAGNSGKKIWDTTVVEKAIPLRLHKRSIYPARQTK